MAKFQFRADHFRAVSMLISKEETRYYLIGVQIEPDPAGGIVLVATDGHKLVVCHDPNGYAERPAILSCDFKAPALKDKRGNLGRRVFLNGDAADIYDTGHGVDLAELHQVPDDPESHAIDRMMFQEVDGRFPDWRRIVPLDVDPAESGVFSFNGKSLKTIIDSAALLTDDHHAQLEIYQNTPTDPAVIRVADCESVVYVIMPVRATLGSSTPDWLRPAPAV